jgi:filamentous hemagglutinin family protein
MYIEQKELFRWRRARKNKQEIAICTKLVVIGQIVLSSISFAVAGPTGEVITNGSGTITRPDAVTTNINQASQRLDINWQTFSTAKTESVNFIQPTSMAVAINRVIGGKPSFLEGALNANGRVFILNESGITFFGTSQVNVGALIATTAKDVTVSDDDKYFAFSGNAYGKVINHGDIHVSEGGFAILAAPYVQNTGTIQSGNKKNGERLAASYLQNTGTILANLGRIELASTRNFTVDLRGDGLIGFTVTKENVDAIAEQIEKLGVDNSGTLQAHSGMIGISANLASSIVQSVVNLGGVVDADAFGAGHNGGTVLVTSVGDLNNTANIHADGGVNGNGGTIYTWADGTNRFASGATMTARGGSDGGNGGLIEVSGTKAIYRGTADASAPKGEGGTLLIDPWDITIANGACPTEPCDPNDPSAPTIYERDIERTSGIGTNVNLLATNSITMNNLSDDKLGGGSGNITMTVGGGNCEKCSITFDDKINDKITTTSGKITLTANDAATSEGGVGTIDIGHLQTAKNGGDITLFAGSGGIHTGDLSTGGTGVSNPGVINLSTTYLGSIETGNVTIVADGAGTASASMSANAGQNLTTGTILITANDTTSPANASATLHAGENIKLKDKATIAATGAGEARAALDARAGKKLDTRAISVMANAHKAGESSAPVTADASAILIAGRDLHADGNVEIRADAGNSWGDATANSSLLAAAGVESMEMDGGKLELTFGNGKLVIDGNVDVTATAVTSSGNANASASMLAAAAVRHVEEDDEDDFAQHNGKDSLTINGNVTVDAGATSSYGNANANAFMLAAAGVKTLKEGSVELTFFGDGGEGSLPGNLTITGDVSVTADATTNNYGNADAAALAVLAAADDVTITTGQDTLQVHAEATSARGNAAADATLIAAAGLESLTVSEEKGVSTVHAIFGGGELTIDGNIDVTADATAHYAGDATAAATAFLAAGNDVNITTGGDTVNVAATAGTDTYYDGEYYSDGGSATAASGLVAAAGLNDITATRAEGSTPSTTMSAGGGDLTVTGDINAKADATVGSKGKGNAKAAASALLAAGNNVDIHTNWDTLKVEATANNYGYGEADATAALLAAAGVSELSVGTNGVPTGVSYGDEGALTVSGNTRVNAEAWENEGEDGGHATANANLLAAGDMDNTFVYDDITVTAKADHSEVNVGDLKTIGNGAEITLAAWNAYGSGDGNNGKVNAGDLKTTGWYADITVDAGYGGIHTGNLSTGGYGEGVAHPGDILLTTTNGGDIQTSNISIIAEGTDSASAYLNANASGNLETGTILVKATDYTSSARAEADLNAGGNITTGGITVAADGAKGEASAMLHAHAGGNIDTGAIEVTANAREGHQYWDYEQEQWVYTGAYANAEAALTAGGNITVTGNVEVDADAHTTYGNATANATLLAAAGVTNGDVSINNGGGELTFGEGSLTINGDVKVKAEATVGSYGSGNATALAGAILAAGNNVDIHTDVDTLKVEADANNYGYGKADAGAVLLAAAGLSSLTVSEGEGVSMVEATFGEGALTITGNVNVTADATAYKGDATAAAVATLVAGDDVTVTTGDDTVRVIATAETGSYYRYGSDDGYGGHGGSATAVSAMVAAAGLDSITVSEAEGSAPSVSLTASSGNLNINGDIKVKAEATVGSYGNGTATALAGAILAAGNNVDIHTDVDTLKVEADANNYGYGKADAGAVLLAAAGLSSLTVSEGEGVSMVEATFGEGALTITGNVNVTADATAYKGDATAAAVATLVAGDDVTVTTGDDTVRVIATAETGSYYRYGSDDGYGGHGGSATAVSGLVAAAGLDTLSVSESAGSAPSVSLTASSGNLNINGDIKVKAEATVGSYGNGTATALAGAILAAGNNVDIHTDAGTLKVKADANNYSESEGGDAAANATLLAAAGVRQLSVSELTADEGEGSTTTTTIQANFGNGSLTITGDIYVTADATSSSGNAHATAAAMLVAGDNVIIDTASPETLKVSAEAETWWGTANANAALIAAAGLDSISITAEEGRSPSVTMTASSGELNDLRITGDIKVKAEATVGWDSSGSGDANAAATALLAAGNNVDIHTNWDTLKVEAIANNYGYGEADATAALLAAAGVSELSVGTNGVHTEVSYGEGDLIVSGNTRVKAEAWENEGEDGGHATANANLLAAGGADNTFVYDDITVTASADHSEVNVGDLKTIGNGAEITLAAWNAYGSGEGNNGTVNAGNLQTTGWYADITVNAGSGGIHTGNLSTGGVGEEVAHPGDIRLTTTNGGNIQTGNISIIAEGVDSASAYLNANASGNLETGSILVKATDDTSSAHAEADLNAGRKITTDSIKVAADGAEGEASAMLHAHAGGNIDTGAIEVTANAREGHQYWDYEQERWVYSAYANAEAILIAGGNITVTGNVKVDADAHTTYGNATANATLFAAAGVEEDEFASMIVDGKGGIPASLSFGEGDLNITGDIKVTAKAQADGGEGGNVDAHAAALFGAANNATILTDPITVEASATNNGTGNAHADAKVIAAAGLDSLTVSEEEGAFKAETTLGEVIGDLYITGDILATARASGGDTDTGRATIDLSATGNITNLYGTTPPTAYAPDPADRTHALVQAPAHLAENFFGEDFSGDGETGDFYASVNINAGGTVKVEPKPSAPVCARDECEVVAALKPVEPIQPLFPGRDPLRIMADGLVVWATGAGVTAPSTGAVVTADIESAIAAGADPTTLLPATAAGGQGLSAGLDAYSIGGLDYCEQVVKGACLPAVEEKGKSR